MSCMATNSAFITLREAAESLGVHESTVRRYADRGIRPLADVNELAAPDLWRSDRELDQFIATTMAERDRDR